METRTRTVTLVHGYDPGDGEAPSRVVELRAPRFHDELWAGGRQAEMRASQDADERLLALSPQTGDALLVLRCIVAWERLPAPQFHHLCALTQGDYQRLHNGLIALVAADKAVHTDEGNGTASNTGAQSSSTD